MIADHYGGKYTLGIGVFITAFFTVIIPPVVRRFDATGLIVLRILMGLGEGTTYPAINVLISQWSPPEEKSRTGTFIYAGALLGLIFATTGSGILLHNFKSWAAVYYFYGAVSIVWFVIWTLFCYNSPQEHPFISKEESNYLKERMGEFISEDSTNIPWRYILTSKPLWASIAGLIGYNWSILTLINELPTYMDKVLKFEVQNNGIFTSSAYFSMYVGGVLSSWLVDRLISNETMAISNVRKYGSILALTGSACIIMIVPYAGYNQYVVVGLLNVSLFVMGTVYPTVMINALDLAPNYAGTLMALTNGISALTGVVSPILIGYLVPDNTLEQWTWVFWILVAVSVITNVIFLEWGDGKIQKWNDPDFKIKKIENNSENVIAGVKC